MKAIIFLLLVIVVGISVSQADAHTAKVLEDYKIDAGWEKEPPIVGEKNAIEVIISLATSYDKQKYDPIFGTILDENKPGPSKSDISGLENALEVTVTVGAGKKSLVTLVEDSNFPGMYHGEYTPENSGKTKIHVFGVINSIEFEGTFTPEKVEKNPELTIEIQPIAESAEIPSWIRNNAGWWAEGLIEDSDFVSGIQFLIKENIINVPKVDVVESSQDIPDWVRNNAGWWAEEQISDNDFLSGIQYLVKNGIIVV